MFAINDKVRIKTGYAGSYDGKTGTVIGFKYSPLLEVEWIRVEFEKPVCIHGVWFHQEIFLPRELSKI